ncbi:MAG: hypothetical protein IJG13_08750 [Kiritimatiellae bacterium]|nr:hypothetical protein [Kiritimatiellia bacterium]MBQ6329629.1 hypothetical protein [Kiritimatiellia bacterium]
MKLIATDTHSIADVRSGGFVYVDKTAIVKILVGVAFDAEMRNLSDRKIEAVIE